MNSFLFARSRSGRVRRRMVSALAVGVSVLGLAAVVAVPAQADIRQDRPEYASEFCDFNWYGKDFSGCVSEVGAVRDVTSGAMVGDGVLVRPGDILESQWTFTNNTDQTLLEGELGFETLPDVYSCGDEACVYGPEVPDTGAYSDYGLVFRSLRVDGEYYSGVGGYKGRTWISGDSLPEVGPGESISVYLQFQVPFNAKEGVKAPQGAGLRFSDTPARAGYQGWVGADAAAKAYVDAEAPVFTDVGGTVFPDHVFAGTAEPGATITLTTTSESGRAGSVGCVTVADGAGDWSCVPGVPLPVGEVSVTAGSVSAVDGYETTATTTVSVVAAQVAVLSTSLVLDTVNGGAADPGHAVGSGDVLGYTITTTNTGTAAGTETLTVTLPAGATLPIGAPWACDATGTCMTTVTVPARGSITTPLEVVIGSDAAPGAFTIGVHTSTGDCPSCTATTTVTVPDTNPGTDPGSDSGSRDTEGDAAQDAGRRLALTGADSMSALGIGAGIVLLGLATMLLGHRRPRTTSRR